ncbi:MAG: DNA methyltransferase [bacterium]
MYLFVFGTHPLLSQTELTYRLSTLGLKTNIILHQDIGILDAPLPLSPKQLISYLGGTIKIGEVIGTANDQSVTAQNDNILNLLQSSLPKTGGKINFGFSLHNISNPKPWHSLALTFKKKLKEQGIHSRAVTSRESTLSSVIVTKEKMLDHGADFIVLKQNNEFVIAKTVAVQDYRAYSQRDYDRPDKDLASGMLPPKIAKILINIAGLKSGTVYDPFCGSGTILQEALLLGYDAIGSDISNKAIAETKNNINWLEGKEDIKNKHIVFQSPIQEAFQKLKQLSLSPDAIVTEPYLGPALGKNAAMKNIYQARKELEFLYQDFLSTACVILKKHSRLVFISPVWFIKEEETPFPVETIINNKLWKRLDNNKLLYHRPSQRVGRRIIALEKI